MKYSFRIIDRSQLAGFRSYLLKKTVCAIESGAEEVLALGVVSGRNACGAAAVYITDGNAHLTDFFIDEAIRGQGAGKFLFDSLMRILVDMKLSAFNVDFIMQTEDADRFIRILNQYGFDKPMFKSKIYKAASEAFKDTKRIDDLFAAAHRDEFEIRQFCDLNEPTLLELSSDESIPYYLSWDNLKYTADPKLSVAAVRDGRVVVYILVSQQESDFSILCAYSREGTFGADFYYAFTELMRLCEERNGSSEYFICFSAIAPTTKRLAKRLPPELLTVYDEYMSTINL